MQSNEIRSRFLAFFEKRGHKIIPSSSLVPEGDISVLFTTAGMQQFKGYYSAPENSLRDFGTKNVTTVQKCVRTGDIDEVGDDTHLSFFEMLGNFSFGGYGRKEAITYAYDFITKELGLTISYVTFYKGNDYVPKDEESQTIWKELDVSLDIREDGADVFWGPTGNSGPCGPTTEIYCKNAKGEDVEIWNIVFNEYFCDGSRDRLDKGEAKLTKLETLGIDTGMGLERLLAIVQKKESVYDTDLFNNEKSKEERIVADHIKASLFMISDGVIPSNTGAGYVLRRLIRRAVRVSKGKSIDLVANEVRKNYSNIYSKINDNWEQKIYFQLVQEEYKFRQTLEKGGVIALKRYFNSVIGGIDPENLPEGMTIRGNILRINGKELFDLYQTHGLPIDVSQEIMKDWGVEFDIQTMKEAEDALKEHQKLSQTASAGMFKGGLANHNEKTIRLHTAHHLLLAALQEVVSKDIKQRGSNITEERLRIDFLCDHKLTDEEKKKVEDLVNEKIQLGLNVIRREMPLAEAEKIGAQMEFGAKYPEIVSVYFIEAFSSARKDLAEGGVSVFSKEFCGGPHVTNTKELGHFKIQKEEAVAQGIRRIKAILE